MPMTPMDSQLRKNIRLTIFSGAALTIIFNLTNPFLSMFVLRLGGTDYHVAWLSALPAFAAMLALIPGGAFIDRFTYKKRITCFVMGISRMFYLCLALVPFLPSTWQATFFVIIIGIMRFPSSVSDIAWQSFYADIIPERHRGFALAQRQRIASIVGMVVTFAAGQVLSYFPKTNLDRIHFYQGFFILAFLIACFEFYTNWKIKEPQYSKEDERESLKLTQTSLKTKFKLLFSSFKTTPQAKRFLIFAICSFTFHFGWQMGWPLFNLYQIKYLHATEAWLAWISVISALTSALTYAPWSRFAEKHGNDITLAITGLGMSITPILYSLSTSLPILAVMNTIVGISTAGFILTLTNMTLIEVPKFQRTLYIACYSTATNISAIFAPNVGVFFNEHFGIHKALLAVAFFRFIGVITFFIRYRYYSHEQKRLLN